MHPTPAAAPPGERGSAPRRRAHLNFAISSGPQGSISGVGAGGIGRSAPTTREYRHPLRAWSAKRLTWRTDAMHSGATGHGCTRGEMARALPSGSHRDSARA
jgi:hypothetical protein